MEPRKKGKAVMGPNTGRKYSAEHQPTPEQKSAGHQKKKLLKDILNAALDPNGVHADMIAKCAEYLGKDIGDVSLAELMHYRIAQKAIQKQDVFAYQAVMDRGFGKPENKTTLANDENNPITPLDGAAVDKLIDAIKKGQK